MRRRAWVRREWLPRWACIALALTSFPVFVYVWGSLIAFVLSQLWSRGFQVISASSERSLLALLIALSVLLAWPSARAVCALLAYRRIETASEKCWKCGYDLEGNVSGTCPECGTATRMELPPNALFFLPASVLKGIRGAFALWFVATTLALLGFARSVLGPAWWGGYSDHPLLDRIWQLTPLVSMLAVAQLTLFIRRGAGTSGIVDTVAAIGMGSSIVATSTQVAFIALQAVGRHPAGLPPYFGAMGLVSMPVAATCFHLVAGSLSGRIPCRVTRTGLYASAALILATAILWFFIVTHPTVLWSGISFLFFLGAMLVSVLSVGSATYRVHRVLRQHVRYDATEEWPTEPA